MGLDGQVFGRLVVVRQAETRVSSGQKKRYVLVRCECGIEKEVRYTHLKQGRTNGCGCKKPGGSKHYGKGTRLYNIWCSIKQRCNDPNHKSFPQYGGKGVVISKSWEHDFVAFRDWAMLNGYADNLTIDRVNNHKEYCPEHCEWVTLQENIRRRDVCKAGGRI